MDVANITDNPAVLQLKPLTDDAVHTLLNAKANNRLLKMVLGILKTPKTYKRFDTEQFCQIRVQVYYAESESTMLSKYIKNGHSWYFPSPVGINLQIFYLILHNNNSQILISAMIAYRRIALPFSSCLD